MPQVDLESLVSACGGGGIDRKIADVNDDEDDNSSHNNQKLEEIASDLPPESFWLSKDAEYDWFDRNAFFERNESTKGSSNSTNPTVNQSSKATSQRFSKTGLIGLPKTQKTNYVDSKRRNQKSSNIRLFPSKRSGSSKKSTVLLTEPSSPKVSCMGRVRSKKGRCRSKREHVAVKPVTESPLPIQRKKGIYSGLVSLFRKERRHRNKSTVKTNDPVSDEKTTPRRKSHEVTGSDPPSLGGMTRFVSGRRSSSWGTDDFEIVRQS
jgi:hypothetical protein